MNIIKNKFNKLFINIDKVFFILGILLLFVYLLLHVNILLFVLGIVFIFSSVFYNIIFNKKNSKILKISNNKFIYFLNVLFIIIYLYVIFNLFVSFNINIIYYILIIIMCSFIFMDIFFINIKTWWINYYIYSKILLISFIIRYNIYFKIYGFYGVDSREFKLYIIDIINTGHINQLLFDKYLNTPAYFIYNSIFSIFTILDVKTSSFLIIFVPWFATLLLMIYVTKKLFNNKFGMLSILLFSISDNAISYSLQGLGWTYAIPLYIVFLYLVITSKTINKSLILLFITSLAITYSHLIPSIYIVLFCILFYIIPIFLSLEQNFKYLQLAITIFLINVTQSVFSYYLDNEIKITLVQYLIELINFQLNRPNEVLPKISSNIPLEYYNYLGYSVLLSLCFLSSIYIIQTNNKNKSIVIINIILLFIPLFVSFIGLNVFQVRWVIYSYVLISIISSQGILYIVTKISNKRNQFISVIFISILYVSPMIYNNISVNVNNIYFNSNTPRMGFYKSEIYPGQYLTSYYDSKIYSDLFTIRAIEIENSVNYYDYLNKSYGAISNIPVYDPKSNYNNIIWLKSFTERVIVTGSYRVFQSPNYENNLINNLNKVYSTKEAGFFIKK